MRVDPIDVARMPAYFTAHSNGHSTMLANAKRFHEKRRGYATIATGFRCANRGLEIVTIHIGGMIYRENTMGMDDSAMENTVMLDRIS